MTQTSRTTDFHSTLTATVHYEGVNFGVRGVVEWDGRTVWESPYLRPASAPYLALGEAESQLALIRAGLDLGSLAEAHPHSTITPRSTVRVVVGRKDQEALDALAEARAALQ